MVLSGGVPHYVAPTYDEELGMAHGVTPDALAEALGRGREAPAGSAFIVSPTYYGLAADVAGLRARSPTPPARRSSSTSRGVRTSASTRASRPAPCPSGPTRC